MAQYGRPDGDITVGSWSPYPSTPTTLWDKIDEVTPNDGTDYIVSSTDEDVCEVSLTDVTDPTVHTGHTIRIYAYSPAGGGAREQLEISLVENGNVRGSSGNQNVSKTAFEVITYTLSEAEAANITNYANLRLRIHITKTDADEPIQVTQGEFECPDAAGAVVDFVGTIGALSNIPDVPLKRIREFVSVAVGGISNIADVVFGRIRGLRGLIAGANELLNGTLDAWTDPNTPTDWSQYVQGGATIDQESSTVYEGSYSAKFTLDDPPSHYAEIHQLHTLDVDTTYELSAWLYIPSGRTANIFLKVEGQTIYLRNDGTWGASQVFANAGTGSWSKFSFNFKPHPDYTSYRLYIADEYYNGVWAFYADDVAIRATAAQVSAPFKPFRGFRGLISGVDALLDGGLEEWTTSQNLTQWTEEYEGAAVPIERELSDVQEGYSSCRMDVNASGDAIRIAQNITLENDVQYVLRWKCKLPVTFNARVILYDTGMNTYLQDDGSWGGVNTISFGGTGSWEQYEYHFRGHPTYTDFIIKFYNVSTGVHSIYWDDISLRKSGSQITGVLRKLKGFVGKIISPDEIDDGGLNDWISDTNLTEWDEWVEGGSTTINRESSDKVEGNYACRIDLDASNSADVYQGSNELTQGDFFTYSIRYKNSIVGKNGFISVQYTSGSTYYLQDDGTWSTSFNTIVLPNSTSWDKFTISFRANYNGDVVVRFGAGSGQASSSSVYFDDIRFYKTSSQITGALTKLKGLAGEIISPNILDDGGVENWISATDLTDWTEWIEGGTSSINRESGDVHGGTYSCRLDIDASANDAQIGNVSIALTPSGHYKIIVWYKNSTTGKNSQLALQDDGFNVWLDDDGLWYGSFRGFSLPNSTVWTTFEFSFRAHPDYSSYNFYLSAGNDAVSSSVYFDDASIRPSNLQVTGILSPLRGLAGVISSAGEFLGDLAVEAGYVVLQGIISATATLTAPLGRIRKFVSVAVGGISNVIGDITVTAGGAIKALAGAVGGISDVLGNLTGTFSFKGSVGGVSGVTGWVKGVFKFIGKIFGSNLLTDGGLNIWTTPTNLTNWSENPSGSSTVNRESSVVYEGMYSCRLDVDVSDSAVYIGQSNIPVLANTRYEVSFMYRTDSGKYCRAGIRDMTSPDYWLQPDGTWKTSGDPGFVYYFTGNLDSSGSWVRFTMQFDTHNDSTGNLYLQLSDQLAASSSIYWDDVSIRKSNSQISAVLGRIRKFVSVAVVGVSGITGLLTGVFNFIGSIGSASGVDAVLKRIRRFVGITVQGISSILGALQTAGQVTLQAVVGIISGVTGGLTGTFSLKGSTGGVSGVADVPLKLLKKFIGEIISSEELTDGGLEDWTSDTDATYWAENISGSSTITKESSQVHGGSFSAKLYIDGSSNYAVLSQNQTSYELDLSYRIEFWAYVESGGVGYCRLASTPGYWKWAKGIWEGGTSGSYYALTGNDTWTKYSLRFRAHPSQNNINLQFGRNSGSDFSWYIDDVSIRKSNSQISAVLERLRKFIGTVGSLSGVDAVLKRIRRFTAPVIEGISSIIAPLTKGAEVILQGVVGAISSVDANILVDYVLSGVTGAVSGVDAALGRVRTFIGTIGSASGVDAVLKRIRRFVGDSIDVLSSVLGNMQKGATQLLQGTIGAISSVADAPLKRIREFIGSIGNTSGVTGVMSVLYEFIGVAVQGISSVTGELGKLGTIVLSGVIGGVSAVDGVLKAKYSLKGITGGVSGVTGYIKYTASFSGLVEALSDLTGTILTSATIILQGTVGVLSDVVGDIKRFRGFTATISSLSDVDAVMKRIRAYIASIAVISDATIVLKRLRRVSGSIAGSSAVDGYVKILKRLIGSITSASIITAPLGRIKQFVGVTISAVSSVAGDLWGGVLYIFPIIFKVIPRERIKHTVSRTREFIVEARKRIFKSDIEEDR